MKKIEPPNPSGQDMYGKPYEDLVLVRTFRDGHQLAVARVDRQWFVYDRDQPDQPWHLHTGPYGSRDDGIDWCKQLKSTNPKRK